MVAGGCLATQARQWRMVGESGAVCDGPRSGTPRQPAQVVTMWKCGRQYGPVRSTPRGTPGGWPQLAFLAACSVALWLRSGCRSRTPGKRPPPFPTADRADFPAKCPPRRAMSPSGRGAHSGLAPHGNTTPSHPRPPPTHLGAVGDSGQNGATLWSRRGAPTLHPRSERRPGHWRSIHRHPPPGARTALGPALLADTSGSMGGVLPRGKGRHTLARPVPRPKGPHLPGGSTPLPTGRTVQQPAQPSAGGRAALMRASSSSGS